MNKQYEAKDIEVLEGLEPVTPCPRTCTDTSRPNHGNREIELADIPTR